MVIYPRFQKHAALAQLVERRLGKAEVGSSNLLGSLNHEAFRNIREAFFRVTENFLLHKKDPQSSLRRSFFIIKILNSMPLPVSVSQSHTREHLSQRTRSGNQYHPSSGSTRSYRTFPLRDGSRPPPHFRSQDRSVR